VTSFEPSLDGSRRFIEESADLDSARNLHKEKSMKTNTTARQAIEALYREVTRNARRDDINAIEERNGELTFSVRYIGNWEVPADEEDDGDYDWKVPTVATRKMLDELIARFAKQFPTVQLSWVNEGEKCWLGFYAKSR
jgi:hypothetical protein